MTTARLSLKGAWIDAAYDGGRLTLAARHKQSEERGRLRRLAVSALREAGAEGDIDGAEVVWSYRAG